MSTTLSATEARKNFFKVIEMAQQPGIPVKITHEGRPTVIMMSEEEFEGWQETLEIMSDPDLVRQIHESERDTESIPLEELVKWEHAQRAHVFSRSPKTGKKGIRKPAHKRSAKSARGSLGAS